MAVASNFASLFEKLKVEDPWLPPRTWESIPSESGDGGGSRSLSHLSSPSQSQPLYNSSTLSVSPTSLTYIESFRVFNWHRWVTKLCECTFNRHFEMLFLMMNISHFLVVVLLWCNLSRLMTKMIYVYPENTITRTFVGMIFRNPKWPPASTATHLKNRPLT